MNRLEPIARHWRGSLLQQGWRVWLAELRACVPSWLARPEPPEQIHHWPLAVPVVSSSTRQVLMLGADAVLLQRVQLPLAAGRNLEAVVGYELDRYTPFEADQLYFVARQERRTPSHLEVTLVAILRERLDQMLTDCAALGLHPHRVDAANLGIDLLPAPLRPRQRRPGMGLQRSLPWLCGALLIAAMVLWLNDRQRVIDVMHTSVQQQKAQVAEVYALRNQPDKVFEWLNRALDIRDPGLARLWFDPFILRYKHDPRFVAFCRKLGLPVTGEAGGVAIAPMQAHSTPLAAAGTGKPR